MESVLAKKQSKVYRKELVIDGKPAVIVAIVRHDDSCGNGYNSFSVTGKLYDRGHPRGESNTQHSNGTTLYLGLCGYIHDLIAEHFPELREAIAYHMCTADGPMHYIAKTVYHVLQHGPDHAWVYFTGPSDPANIGGTRERLLDYVKAEEARKLEGAAGYRVQWDEETVKVRNLDLARSCAIWPDATDEDLTAPGLDDRLRARYPQLMADFRRVVESLGLTY